MELHLSLNEIRQKFNLPEDVKIVICDDSTPQNDKGLVIPDSFPPDLQPNEIKSLISQFNALKPKHKSQVGVSIFWTIQDLDSFIQIMNKRKIEHIESFCKSKGKPPNLVWKTVKKEIELVNAKQTCEIFWKWGDLDTTKKNDKLISVYDIESQTAVNIVEEIHNILTTTDSWKIKTPQINSVFHARNLKSEPFWRMLKSL